MDENREFSEYKKSRREKWLEIFRYGITGVLTTAIDYGTTALMKLTGDHAWLDSIVAWIVSVVFFAFWVYKFYVFRSKSMRKKLVIREFFSFVAARLFTLGFQTLFLFVFIDLLGFDRDLAIVRVADGSTVIVFSEYWIFKVAATVVVTVLNYIASKLIIFRVEKKKATEV